MTQLREAIDLAEEEYKRAQRLTESIRKDNALLQNNTCASWLFNRLEAEEHEALAHLVSLEEMEEHPFAAEEDEAPMKGILWGVPLGFCAWAILASLVLLFWTVTRHS